VTKHTLPQVDQVNANVRTLLSHLRVFSLQIYLDTMVQEDNQEHSSPVMVQASAAQTFVEGVLVGNGVPPHNASIIAECLVQADLRGVDTHGINRVPSYMVRIQQGVLDAKASPLLNQITPVVAQVDGKNGFGFLAAQLGMSCAITMAKEFGIGMVSIKHSNHFGMSAWIVQQALDADMMSLVFTNSSPRFACVGRQRKTYGRVPNSLWSTSRKDKAVHLGYGPLRRRPREDLQSAPPW